MAETYSAGDRVLLKPCESWNLPWRAFANEARGATVELVTSWGQVKIVFDVRRKGAKGRDLFVSPRDILPHPKENDRG